MTKEPCRYSGHNEKERRAAITRPDGKQYWVDFPENEPDDRNILTWIKPMVNSLTISYWRDIALDKAFNIKREQSVGVEGLRFLYDYRDGIVEVYDIKNTHSIYKSAMKLFTISEETKQKIKESINEEVTDVVFIDYRNDNQYIKINI